MTTEKQKEYRKNYYLKHKDSEREYKREWEKNNKDKKRAYSIVYRKKHSFNLYIKDAKKRGLLFSITEELFEKLRGGKCYYCDSIENIGIDRVDNNIGYIKKNIVSCCSTCNMMKRAYDKDYFINQCKKVSNNFKNNIL